MTGGVRLTLRKLQLLVSCTFICMVVICDHLLCVQAGLLSEHAHDACLPPTGGEPAVDRQAGAAADKL